MRYTKPPLIERRGRVIQKDGESYMRRVLFSSFAALTFLAAAGAAGAETPSIPALIGSKQVLVVGESYGRPESARFVSDSVSAYLKGGGCLKVGLEIPSDQQDVLDSAMKGCLLCR